MIDSRAIVGNAGSSLPLRVIAGLALALWGAAGSPVAAQSPTPGLAPARQDPAAAEAAYRDAVSRGVTAFDGRQWAEARSAFEQAHALRPNARTWRSLGLTSFELKDYVTALAELQAALRDPRQPLTEAQRVDVNALLQDAALYIGRYQLEVTPRDASVTVDGAEVVLEGAPLMLNLGRHEVQVSAAGHDTHTESLQVEGGEQVQLRIALVPTPTTTEPPPKVARVPSPPPSTPPPVQPPSPTGWLGPRHSWALGAALGALGAGGIGLVSDEAQTRWVVVGVAGASALVSVVLWSLPGKPRPRDSGAPVAVEVAVGVGVLGARGRF